MATDSRRLVRFSILGIAGTIAFASVAVIKACLYEPQVNRTYAEMDHRHAVVQLAHELVCVRDDHCA